MLLGLHTPAESSSPPARDEIPSYCTIILLKGIGAVIEVFCYCLDLICTDLISGMGLDVKCGFERLGGIGCGKFGGWLRG